MRDDIYLKEIQKAFMKQVLLHWAMRDLELVNRASLEGFLRGNKMSKSSKARVVHGATCSGNSFWLNIRCE